MDDFEDEFLLEDSDFDSGLEDGQCGHCMKKQPEGWQDRFETTYSQGTVVCIPCKANSQKADNRAFDRDMALR